MNITQVEPGVSRTSDKHTNNNGPSVAVVLITIIPQFLWPILVLSVIILYNRPLYNVTNAVANQIAGGGASIEIGEVKITLQRKNIPDAPKDVKELLPEIDASIISFIIRVVGGGNTVDTCTPDDLAILYKLQDLKMMTITTEQLSAPDGKGVTCVGYKYHFTALYDSVRTYLVSILTSATFSY
jgi:hypothetical protein